MNHSREHMSGQRRRDRGLPSATIQYVLFAWIAIYIISKGHLALWLERPIAAVLR